MALRRGFKTDANEIARSIRRELQLRFEAPLNPWILADHLAIPVIPMSKMRALAPRATQWFSTKGSSEFSAVTVFRGSRRVVVYNDSHSVARQASDIGHEISHGILLHLPGPALDHNGCRIWNEDMEDEADWLSGSLLISEEAALRIVRSKMSPDEAMKEYGVSKKMLDWRIRMTGAQVRVSRAARYSRRRF